ncbi:MAG: RHS repeat-associated core domain-containing protein [Flavobacteriaceae bacterium]|jgi:RHS repeat-associated protein|nr:RHS repeat-associated core domain-containing protein [Flavobacteriaceae bacterium]
MKKILYILSFVFVAIDCFAQTIPSSAENYIFSTTYLTEDKSKKIETIRYFDGLGRLKQGLAVKVSASGKDMVIPMEYDNMGRQTKSYLPIPKNSLNGAIQPIDGSTVNSYYGVSNAYSESVLDDSPLNRLTQSAFPGNDWKKDSGHTVKYDIDLNTSAIDGTIKQFSTSTTWTNGISYTDFTISSYPNFQLFKKKITDEDNNDVIVFKNKLGQIILERRINKNPDGSTQNIDTYYVYNEYSQLAYMIPPLAAAKTTLVQNDLDELCYQYRYDKKNRLVEKKIPGKGWEYMVYDKIDQLILTQDANLRLLGKWLIAKYDKFGRVIYTGKISGGSRADMQNQAKDLIITESPSTSGFSKDGIIIYYTNNFFYSLDKIFSVNYYDKYPADTPTVSTLGFTQTFINDDATNNNISTKSFPTASYVNNIDTNQWTKTYSFYDAKGRPIAAYARNYLGGYTKTENVLDFTGVTQNITTKHKRKNSDTETVIFEKFEYDNQNRLLVHKHKINNNAPEILAENHYNEIGQLDWKKVGNNIQKFDYFYNIRGWLTFINNPASLEDDIFGYRINYNQVRGLKTPNADYPNLEVKPRYNGSIAEVEWMVNSAYAGKQTPPGPGMEPTPHRYGYVYDGINRLLAGFYQNPTDKTSKENSEILTYDLNGNIKTLKRSSYVPTNSTFASLIDDLVYTYAGNRVTNINDLSNDTNGYEGGNYPISYDANGNMINMQDKGISNINYNLLNLPVKLQINNGVTVNYLYRADGVKLKKTNITVAGTTTTTSTTDYLDGFQYLDVNITGRPAGEPEVLDTDVALEPEAFQQVGKIAQPPNPGPVEDNAELQFVPTSEGFYSFTENRYIYTFKDHLGNVRISFAKNSAGDLEAVDRNDYYPFGMNFLGTDTEAYYGHGSYANYKFNGKELQETGMYDYGARFYMPDIGRWGVVDPLAELSPDITPYRYAFNNPISYTDPTGMYEDWDWRDYDDDNGEDRYRDDYAGHFNFYFDWEGENRSYGESNDLWDFITGKWDIDIDFAFGSGGDPDMDDDFMEDMMQENLAEESIDRDTDSDYRSYDVPDWLEEYYLEKQDMASDFNQNGKCPPDCTDEKKDNFSNTKNTATIVGSAIGVLAVDDVTVVGVVDDVAIPIVAVVGAVAIIGVAIYDTIDYFSQRKGERNWAGNRSGTSNPAKHLREKAPNGTTRPGKLWDPKFNNGKGGWVNPPM